jgi:hypothetical protein
MESEQLLREDGALSRAPIVCVPDSISVGDEHSISSSGSGRDGSNLRDPDLSVLAFFRSWGGNALEFKG